MKNDEMLYRAKELAAITINRELIDNAKNIEKILGKAPKEVKLLTASDMYIVWFSKTLQNWKALVSTGKIGTEDQVGDYVEVTHNGDKGETYCDLYKKQRNISYSDDQ